MKAKTVSRDLSQEIYEYKSNHTKRGYKEEEAIEDVQQNQVTCMVFQKAKRDISNPSARSKKTAKIKRNVNKESIESLTAKPLKEQRTLYFRARKRCDRTQTLQP